MEAYIILQYFHLHMKTGGVMILSFDLQNFKTSKNMMDFEKNWIQV